MGEWQPMGTAPKDGTGVLLHCPTYPEGIVAAVWSQSRGGFWGVWGLSSVAFNFDDEDMPTHWRPFPKPPKSP